MSGLEDIQWTHLRQVLEEYGDYFISLARADLDANNTNATMSLYDSMKTIVDIGDDRFEVDIELNDYWYYVEHGRGPGKFPPPNRIKDWIKAKQIMPTTMTIKRKWKLKDGTERERDVVVTPTVDQLAFLIGRKIATEGTDPQPFFEKNKRITYKHFQSIIAEAIDEDIADYIERAVLQRMYNMKFMAL